MISTLKEQTGHAVLETHPGGKGGGYSHLTKETRELMQRYDAFCTEAQEAFQNLFEKYLTSETRGRPLRRNTHPSQQFHYTFFVYIDFPRLYVTLSVLDEVIHLVHSSRDEGFYDFD